ncbi:MAG: trypsin-like peptidase domain-containing protein [Deltaproteobacteria bacterium]|nr:trypsin-like peptidase domain-containing protein [Deltaproteobacteria bacterium]
MLQRLAAIACLAACASPAPDVPLPFGPSGKADYYGNDDRQQILDARHPRAVEWARATAIIANRSRFASAGGAHLAANAQTLGERHSLCSDERFAAEPVLGFCSAFLIAPDLVATAGHCFKDTLCEQMAFVFDFYKGGASENVDAIPARNVFTCTELVARQYGNGLDYAVVRLDRPATGRTPFAMQLDPPAVGARVALLGYPSGILAKLDLAGKVLRVEGSRRNRVRTSVDSFPGHSGGAMIDLETGSVFGVHVEGSTPSYVSDGGCTRAAACPTVSLGTPGFCDGAVETSIEPFGGLGGGSGPSTAATCGDRCGATDGVCSCDLDCETRGDCCTDFAPTCKRNSNTPACLGGGAPCGGGGDCANAMCACDSVNMTTESFVVPGRCTASGCTDQQALCEAACADMDLDGQRFTMGWWLSTCESE